MHIYIFMHIHICTPCSECVENVFVDVEETPVERTNLHVHWCTGHLFQSACNTQCKKIHIHVYLHTYAYTYKCIRIHMRMHDTVHTLKH